MVSTWFKTDMESFLPEGFGSKLVTFNSFPATRWNFILYQTSNFEQDAPKVRELCQAIEPQLTPGSVLQCGASVTGFQAELSDWAKDLPLRAPYPGDAVVLSQIDNTLSMASMPLPGDLVSVLRNDPFSTYQDFLELAQRNTVLDVEFREDLVFNSENGNIILPLKFGHQAFDTDATDKVSNTIDAWCQENNQCDRVSLTGGYFSSSENKTQIMKDLDMTSWVGTIALVGLFLFLLFTKRQKSILMFIPVILGALLAGGVVILIDGYIHALTLSFGFGLVGLAMDHGIHVALARDTRGAWVSNFLALLTTLVVLAVIAFSEIPVLRQLMIFTCIGLTFSFALIYAMQTKWNIQVRPLHLRAWKNWPVTIALVVSSIWGLVKVGSSGVDLGLMRMNFMSEKTAAAYYSFASTIKLPPLFRIATDDASATGGEGSALHQAHSEKSWADAHGIRVENAAKYLPPLEQQSGNHASWLGQSCIPSFTQQLAPVQQQFFQPYWDGFSCTEVVPRTLQGPVPAYVDHLHKDKQWLTLFFPKTVEQKAAVKEAFNDAFSLQELAEMFPKFLLSELRWMVPTSLAIIFGLLLIAYRKIYESLVALLPFAIGVGITGVVMQFTGDHIDFVSIISFLMMCSLSVDYGIFVVDSIRSHGEIDEGIVTALIFCSATTVAGVLPLMFCEHPVLRSLGIPLGVGITVAMAASLVVVPTIYRPKTMKQSIRTFTDATN